MASNVITMWLQCDYNVIPFENGTHPDGLRQNVSGLVANCNRNANLVLGILLKMERSWRIAPENGEIMENCPWKMMAFTDKWPFYFAIQGARVETNPWGVSKNDEFVISSQSAPQCDYNGRFWRIGCGSRWGSVSKNDCALKTRNCVYKKTRNCVFKMMNFSGCSTRERSAFHTAATQIQVL